MIKVKTFFELGGMANCYAVENEGIIALIDPGSTSSDFEDYLMLNKDKIKYILLTHCHFDHICGVKNILEKCPYAKVCICTFDKAGLYDDNHSMCSHIGVPVPDIEPDIEVEDGDTIEFGDEVIEVINTPGHTIGSVVYIIGDQMFTGDTLFKLSAGRTDFYTGDPRMMVDSFNRLYLLEKDYTVYPGHGMASALSYEKTYNPFFNIEL